MPGLQVLHTLNLKPYMQYLESYTLPLLHMLVPEILNSASRVRGE